MGLAWPEKVVVVFAIVVMLAMFVFWALLADGARTTHDARLNDAALHWFIQAEIILILPLWLVLRAIYLVTQNWGRRRPQRCKKGRN